MKTLAALPAVETPGLVVREIGPADWRPFAGFMISREYQSHIAMRLRNVDEVKSFVARNVARQDDARRNVYHLAAESRETGEAIGDGFIIFHRAGAVEIGWGVAPRLWGRGYGTEIGVALLGLAFERLQADEAWCKVMVPNAASACLARRIGMKLARSQADYPVGGGRFGPVEMFKIGRDGYFALPY
jgi:[ribosomal protein S5]-alanine N-acetyltransferase